VGRVGLVDGVRVTPDLPDRPDLLDLLDLPGKALLVADEVAAASYFDEILRTADKWNHVECGVHRTAQESLAANRAAERHQRDDPANPRHRSNEAPRHPAGGVLSQLFANGHVAS